MSRKIRIALDAMGGDHGPSVVISGAALALEQHPDSTFLLFGDQTQIDPLLARHPALAAVAQVTHTDVAVRMDDKPSQALRNGRWKSSMWLAIDAVKKGDADAAVSAGNTGALMAMAKFNLRMVAGIERPAIAGLWPTMTGHCIVLDLGASIGAAAEHLVDLAVMGSAMARVLQRIDRPRVGLLNIGVEEVKGLEPVREAGRILREDPPPHIEYIGFVEGDDIGRGKADVVVTEGFAGNIALKTAEGTARQFADILKDAISQSMWSKLGYVLARPAFRKLRAKMDPNNSNGGVFLGLNGVVIKSHGGTNAAGFASAVGMGYEMVQHELLGKIAETIQRHTEADAPPRPVLGAVS